MTATALQKMHRRAQKAEGELARLHQAIISAGRQGRKPDRSRYYYMIGWMVSHTAPSCHLIGQTDAPVENPCGDRV